MFEYTVGKIKFTKRGYKPSKDNVKIFLEGVLPMIEQQGYQANILGRVLYDWTKTNDFDLALTGTITDYDKLEQLFFDLYSYSYNTAGIMLDLKWISDTNTCELDSNFEPVHRDVDEIIIRYFHLLTDTINRTNEYLPPSWTKVSEWLVKGNCQNNRPLVKLHHIEHVKQHGGFQSVTAREFLQNIDQYFKEKIVW